jgi:hypothetical protein
MKLWKIFGYCFTGLGLLIFCYGFTNAFLNMLNPSTIWGLASSGQTVDFFSAFWSETAGWIMLSIIVFIVGGIGLFIGRSPKLDKRSNDERIEELEEKLKAFSIRLDELEGESRAKVAVS